MDYSATFARHFARLVWLLVNEVGNVDEQKMSLRALVMLSRNGVVTLLSHELHLLANEQLVPAALTGVQDVTSQMAAHSIESIDIQANAKPADILGLARILAAAAVPGDGGANARQKLEALGARGITVATTAPSEPAAGERAAEPVTAPMEAPTAPSIDAAGMEKAGAAPAATEWLAQEQRGREQREREEREREQREREQREQEQRAREERARKVAAEAATAISPLAGPDVTKVTPEELFAALSAAVEPEGVTRALDDLVTLAEHSVRVAKPAVVGAILHEIVDRDARLPDGEIKRAFVMAIRRLSKPALLRAVASMIPKKPERRQHYYEVLARTGEEGADALIEQITQAPTANDRRMLMEVLTLLDDAIPALVRMLGDSRWFVVRNAADLLGEIQAANAEEALIALLRHEDDRVRRSATNALMALGTTAALRAIYEAVNDSSPEVRMQVASAIATRKDSKTSNTLIRAIDEESDADVQLAMIAALGRVATPDAVQKLVRMAQPEGRLFRKKDAHLRVAAAQALGDARTPAAITALKELLGDKDRDVRETATRALAHADR